MTEMTSKNLIKILNDCLLLVYIKEIFKNIFAWRKWQLTTVDILRIFYVNSWLFFNNQTGYHFHISYFFYRRTKSLGEYDDFDEDDFFDNENSYVNWERHEYCYDEFEGYGDEYDGPRGILTSFLPDGTSVSPTKERKISLEGIVYTNYLFHIIWPILDGEIDTYKNDR